ncbi:HNH endonuclease [Paraburkholderia sediminicola]|uniref:HNH endonuclease n=1 Tax=Paraburkholderia sediminicola TaxID=458836 RepID=UPI0038BDAA00
MAATFRTVSVHNKLPRASARLDTPVERICCRRFITTRAGLQKVAYVLRPLQDDSCFFCREKLRNAGVVDHFIPWSRYPRDTALNFVLAHSVCNGDKRDLLAGQSHLERWLERNERQGAEVGEALSEVGFLMEPAVTTMIARWAYNQTIASEGHFWVGYKNTEKASADILRAFS